MSNLEVIHPDALVNADRFDHDGPARRARLGAGSSGCCRVNVDDSPHAAAGPGISPSESRRQADDPRYPRPEHWSVQPHVLVFRMGGAGTVPTLARGDRRPRYGAPSHSLQALVRHTSARTAIPPICSGYVAKWLMWRPLVFFREIPSDLTADGHITSRSPATETGLAVHHRKAGVLAVFDRLAVVGAFRRASSVMTASVSDGRPIQAAMFVMWRREQRKRCFSPNRDSQDHTTGKAT